MRILMIVNPERIDFYSYLHQVPDVEWLLLWHEKSEQMMMSQDKLPLPFKEIYFWTDFTTPRQLLEKINPDRIVFFEIIDLRQIALNVAASALNIPTFYLEHGAAGDRNTAILRWKETTFKKNKLPYLIKRFKHSFIDVIRSKIFYYSVSKGFNSIRSYIVYFLLPFKMLKNAPNKVLSKNLFRERIPWRSIVFNETNFEEYSLYTGIGKQDAVFSGVPHFDHYFRESQQLKDHIVYIDHPYLEEGLLGWTEEHHQQIASALFHFAEEKQIKLYIKLHPRSNLEYWKRYARSEKYIQIIQTGDYTDLYLDSRLILGYSSSLLNGFLCAKKNVVLLGWHPQPQIFGADFSKTGLCHISYKTDELYKNYDYWLANNLSEKNETAWMEFMQKYNYPFDGKATQRVVNIICC